MKKLYKLAMVSALCIPLAVSCGEAKKAAESATDKAGAAAGDMKDKAGEIKDKGSKMLADVQTLDINISGMK